MDAKDKLLHEALTMMKQDIHPGRGRKHARFVRKVCEQMGWDEDEFLDRWVVRDKKTWGL